MPGGLFCYVLDAFSYANQRENNPLITWNPWGIRVNIHTIKRKGARSAGQKVKAMWSKGPVNGYQYFMKSFDTPSEFGINEGRISKLVIKKDGHILYNFERGLDFDKMDDGARDLYEYLMDEFN